MLYYVILTYIIVYYIIILYYNRRRNGALELGQGRRRGPQDQQRGPQGRPRAAGAGQGLLDPRNSPGGADLLQEQAERGNYLYHIIFI